jgi:hypothetical protein
MDGLPAETADVLRDLIATSEAHRGEQMALLHALSGRGESTDEAIRVLGQIEDTLAAMRSRRAYLQALGGSAR